jgi:hypothetical protein
MNTKKMTGGLVFPVVTRRVLEDVDMDYVEADDVEIKLKDAALKGAVR